MNPKIVPLGIKGLDQIFGGGFRKGSLIVVAGNPGVGKTVFSASWLYHGALDLNEPGVYVSFAESRESFIENMRNFGYDFERLEAERKFQFLDLFTVKGEGISDVFNWILDRIYSLKAKRLVIDSFSAVAQAFKRPIDMRSFIHTILSKVLRKAECTTLLILEVPYGEEKIGYGIEEFLADVVILLQRKEYDGVIVRELSILKNRWSEITRPKYVFTLKNGFQVLMPLSTMSKRHPIAKYAVIPHRKDYFSTGVKDLDDYLGRRIRGGGYNLLEIESDVAFPIERLICPFACNFLNQGHGVVILPPQGMSARTIRETFTLFVDRKFHENLVITDYKGREESGIILLEGRSLEEDMKKIWSVISELREKTGKSVLSIMGFDTMEYNYGEREALKILGEDVALIRNNRDIRLNVIRPLIHVADELAALSDVYLRIEMLHDALFIRGIKPKTPLLNIGFEMDERHFKIKLTPVI